MAGSNGKPRTSSLTRLRQQRDRLKLRLQIRETRARADSARRLRESWEFDWLDSYVNLLGELKGPGPFLFGPSTLQDRRTGRDWPIFANEVQLAIYRQPARILCTTNPYAIGLLNGLTSYVIGTGGTYRVVAKKGKQASDKELSDAQEFWDSFARRERWWQLERELFWRRRRDGEFFLWINHKDGIPWARTVEPEQVMPPYSGGAANTDFTQEESPEAWSFGLLSSLEDTQSIQALWFKNFVHPTGHRVPWSQIVHGKANVDRVIKRGFTDFSFDLYDALHISSKLRRNLGLGAAVRAALAGIREHDATSSDDAQAYHDSFVTNTTTDPVTGQTIQHAKLEPGSFADMPKGVTFKDPPQSPDTAAQVEILQACLRGATTRYNAPDWLASAAAADNTFAGALTAESPFIKFVETEQKEHTELYTDVAHKVLRIGCETGQLPPDLLERVEMQVKLPSAQARNTLQQAQENDVKLQSQVMSVQQWCEEDGRDYEETMTEIEAHAERVANLPQPGQPAAMAAGAVEPPATDAADVPDLSGGAGEHQDLTEPHPPGSGGAALSLESRELLESILLEGGFTGVDAHGHKWVNGKQVKIGKPAPAVTPVGGGATGPFEKAPATRGQMMSAVRIGKGKEAKIVLRNGKPAPGHITPGMVPPDWSDVQISIDPHAELQVRAVDGKGRAKSVYTDSHDMRTAAVKFARVDEMIRQGSAIDRQIQEARANPKTKEQADCAWLIATQATRPGSESDTGARVKAYGATTLEGRHVVKDADGSVRLHFIGKEGVLHNHRIHDPELAQMLLGRKRAAGDTGQLFATNEGRLDTFIKKLDGGHFSAKDFRTRRANLIAVRAMAKFEGMPKDEKQYKARVKAVALQVSTVLGNKPEQCLESYINPVIFSVWRAMT